VALSAFLLSISPLALGALGLPAPGTAALAGGSFVEKLTPVTDEMLQHPPADDWLMRRGNYRAWSYSPLKQISAENVGRLKLAWAWNMAPGYAEAAPLAHNGVVFLESSRNVVQALDGRSGDLLWEYHRDLPKVEGGYHNDLLERTRGTIALYADKVFLTTADAHVVALDARTGKVVWDTEVADFRKGYTFTGGPLVAKGKVIAGISGCTNPTTAGGCFIVAVDASTGKQAWLTHTIAQPGSPGDESWKGLPVEKRNGGSSMDRGKLRSSAQSRVFRNRRPDSALRDRARHGRRRCPVHGFNARPRRGHREDRLVPAVSAAR
jgi:alcohol dehydrogenase (cytochrome c)